MKKRNAVYGARRLLAAMTTLLIATVPAWAGEHPELSEQEKLVACSDCHKEATPEVTSQWFDSLHGIAMVKCYQCHGTFETFKLTPEKADCAVCHADMINKCPDKPCWDCHVPHDFKLKK